MAISEAYIQKFPFSQTVFCTRSLYWRNEVPSLNGKVEEGNSSEIDLCNGEAARLNPEVEAIFNSLEEDDFFLSVLNASNPILNLETDSDPTPFITPKCEPEPLPQVKDEPPEPDEKVSEGEIVNVKVKTEYKEVRVREKDSIERYEEKERYSRRKSRERDDYYDHHRNHHRHYSSSYRHHRHNHRSRSPDDRRRYRRSDYDRRGRSPEDKRRSRQRRRSGDTIRSPDDLKRSPDRNSR